MPRRKVIPIKSEIITLPILEEQLSLKELHNRVIIETNNKKGRSLEQKIIALKILQLNDMKYTQTEKEVGVTKKTLYSWWVQYGELIKKIEPEEAIVRDVATGVLKARGVALEEWYNLLDKSAKKLGKLVDESTGTRSIYAIVEAVKASAEVIKLDKEASDPNKSKNSEYFLNFYNTLIQNKYGNQG